ncbi:hypothetical protein CAPTEDRAFT_222214 [Capitella teleta]|uniref:Methyltransferase domain-containing protein n=1 Tax=Capitella teleta TaxID=283909 RepID=R7VJS7_CAPTE|nr:hypothetical protein CAPTEDRAFT_222214 [Capitella teleta]|eukprot:ELU16741.1 hypothetical protein CAPTEDRAFT_222214 [Capitella teleta]
MDTQKPPNASPPTHDEALDRPNGEIPKRATMKAGTVCTEQQSQVSLFLFWMTSDDLHSNTPRCLSSLGCNVDFASKVAAPREDMKVGSLEGFADVEKIYQDEITKLTREIIDLKTEMKSYDGLKHDRFNRNNCSSLLVKDGRVRECLTGDVIGMLPANLDLVAFRAQRKISQETDAQRAKSFQKVFESRAWGHSWDAQYHGINASGMGATLAWTQETTSALNIIISDIKRELGVQRIKLLDVPCGDLAWMSRFLKTRNDIDYTGIDIVTDLIEHHKNAFKHPSWTFEQRDIVKSPIKERYDLILCRTLLQHLFNSDAMKVLDSFSKSGSRYLFLTTWSRNTENEDLTVGDWNPGRMRRLNAELPPLSLSPPLCLQRDGPPDAIEGWDHFLGLWKLPLSQLKECPQSCFYYEMKHTSCTSDTA